MSYTTNDRVRAALLAYHSGDMDWDSQDEELMRLALAAAYPYLTEEVERLREALEFYADDLTWADTNPKNDGRITVLVPSPSFAEIDRGERARAALNPVGEP